jgi:hypothetical protein
MPTTLRGDGMRKLIWYSDWRTVGAMPTTLRGDGTRKMIWFSNRRQVGAMPATLRGDGIQKTIWYSNRRSVGAVPATLRGDGIQKNDLVFRSAVGWGDARNPTGGWNSKIELVFQPAVGWGDTRNPTGESPDRCRIGRGFFYEVSPLKLMPMRCAESTPYPELPNRLDMRRGMRPHAQRRMTMECTKEQEPPVEGAVPRPSTSSGTACRGSRAPSLSRGENKPAGYVAAQDRLRHCNEQQKQWGCVPNRVNCPPYKA